MWKWRKGSKQVITKQNTSTEPAWIFFVFWMEYQTTTRHRPLNLFCKGVKKNKEARKFHEFRILIIFDHFTLKKKKCCMTPFQNEKHHFWFWKVSCHFQKASAKFFFVFLTMLKVKKRQKKTKKNLADVKKHLPNFFCLFDYSRWT